MRKMSVPGYFGSLFLSMCVAAALLVPTGSRQALYAQTQTAPAAGTSVVVRMMDAVNSANDPAGKQYRASVSKAVDAGNGVTIPQGAAAVVTLAKSGSGYAAQLVSVIINGQPVAVASSSASVTSAAQNAANAMNSILGGFGHHVNAPSGVTAVAMGQRVVLPPGATLTFVLSQPPAPMAAASTSPAAPSAPAAQPMTASTAPSPSPAAATTPTAAATSSTGGPFIACATSQDGGIDNYVTAVFQTTLPVRHLPNGGNLVDQSVLDRFYAYLKQKGYNFKPGSNYGCAVGQTEAEAEAAKHQRFEMGGCSNCGKVVQTGWKDGSGEAAAPAQQLTASASSPNPAAGPATSTATVPAAAPNEHYVYCLSGSTGPAVYFSDIFAAVPTSPTTGPHSGWNGFPEFSGPFLAFLQNKYGYKSDPSNSPVVCSAIYNPNPAGLHAAQATRQAAEDSTKQANKQVVETGWKDTQ